MLGAGKHLKCLMVLFILVVMSAKDDVYEVQPLDESLDEPPELTFNNIIANRKRLLCALTSKQRFLDLMADERLGPHTHLAFLLSIVFVLAIAFSIYIAVG